MGGEIEVKYRVYYKQMHKNINYEGFYFTDAFDDVDDARSLLK